MKVETDDDADLRHWIDVMARHRYDRHRAIGFSLKFDPQMRCASDSDGDGLAPIPFSLRFPARPLRIVIVRPFG
jgi:hypothetical protein